MAVRLFSLLNQTYCPIYNFGNQVLELLALGERPTRVTWSVRFGLAKRSFKAHLQSTWLLNFFTPYQPLWENGRGS
ncbi:hypothetical protein J4O75_16505 [Paenibacillus pabuli]